MQDKIIGLLLIILVLTLFVIKAVSSIRRDWGILHSLEVSNLQKGLHASDLLISIIVVLVAAIGLLIVLR